MKHEIKFFVVGFRSNNFPFLSKSFVEMIDAIKYQKTMMCRFPHLMYRVVDIDGLLKLNLLPF